MQISWNGLACFEITTKTSDGEVVIVTDPYDAATGLKQRALEAQIVTISHKGNDADNVSAVTGSPFRVDLPGEFEVKGVFVYAVSAPNAKGDNRICRIESEDMSVAHLGALDRMLTDEEIESLKDVDILMIPVGGGRVLDGKKAAEIIAAVEPRVVIPMTYEVDGLKEELQPVSEFVKAMGGARKEEMNKYKVARKDLPEEDMIIVVLTR